VTWLGFQVWYGEVRYGEQYGLPYFLDPTSIVQVLWLSAFGAGIHHVK